MCQNCGALVGPDEQSCSLCGAAKTSGAAAQSYPTQRVYDYETVRFARAILGRPYIFTIIFLIANVFIFLLMWSSSGLNNDALWQPQEAVLRAYGAKYNYLIQVNHEWWRLVTPVFIHIGLLHLLVNMYGLWMLGPYVERLYGSAKFVVLWVVTGIAGVVASYLCVRPELATTSIGRFLFKATDGPSAGASGALFGLIGVLFVFGIKFRRELPEGFKRAFGTGLLPVIMINLFIGFLGRGFIDNAAHLGGLASGAVFGLLISYKRPDEPPRVAVVWHVLQVAALALVVVSFVMVGRNFSNNRSSPDQVAMLEQMRKNETSKFTTYLNALGTGDEAFVNAFNNGDNSGISDAVRQLDEAPPVDEKTDALRDELKGLLTRVDELNTKGKTDGRALQQAREKDRKVLLIDFQAWRKRRRDLIKTEGGRYGVRLKEPPAQTDSAEGK